MKIFLNFLIQNLFKYIKAVKKIFYLKKIINKLMTS